MVKIMIKGQEKEVVLKEITMGDQEAFLEEGEKIEETNKPSLGAKYFRETVCKFTNLSKEEYLNMTFPEAKKVIKELMEYLRSYDMGKDF